MPSKHRVQSVYCEKSDAVLHEVQIHTDGEWKTMEMYGQQLKFRLEQAAQLKLHSILRK